jgi:hypothetical protein
MDEVRVMPSKLPPGSISCTTSGECPAHYLTRHEVVGDHPDQSGPSAIGQHLHNIPELDY